ncbi:MAG: response regulator [Desulfobacteraceae bacterium]|nr:response regulator [Desulfobacteraceae bacterium]
MNSVLIIDDEESIRYSFERILRANGYDAYSAASFEEAETLLESREINAAVIDRILSGGENGIEISQKIKEIFPFCEIILVSAYPTFESAAKTLEISLSAYLTKPVTKKVLLEYVNQAVEKSRAKKSENDFEKALELLFEKSPDGILICERSGKVKYCNKTFKKIFSIDDGDKDDAQLLSLLNVKGFSFSHENKISEFFIPETIEETEVPIDSPKRKDGFYSVSKYAYGNNLGYLISIKDITEKKVIEQSFERSSRMEAIGNFAGGIAHDFNNILHVITGYGELAAEMADKKSDISKYINEILKAAQRAGNITEQILSFSRAKGEKSEPVDIEPLLREVIVFLKSTIPSTISIKENITKNLGPVCASKAKIHQLIMNLASNSAKAMNEKGGDIVIGLEAADRSDLLKIEENPGPGDFVKIYVRDTGKGIDKEHLEKIFQPFFTTREGMGGSGIGLSIVYGIVKKMGGLINVESEIGRGALFEIYLPVASALSVSSQTEKTNETFLGQGRILFVDDDENIVKIAAKMIAHMGYEVDVFTDSEKALEAFLENPRKYDAVITDMTMPKIRGDELASKVASVSPQIPVVLSTGFSEKLLNGEVPFGVKKILNKPVDRVTLGNVLKEILA